MCVTKKYRRNVFGLDLMQPMIFLQRMHGILEMHWLEPIIMI